MFSTIIIMIKRLYVAFARKITFVRRRSTELLNRLKVLFTPRGQWKRLRDDLGGRLSSPWGDVPFVFYLVGGTIGCGALGVWIECVHLIKSLPTISVSSLNIALMSYFPALIGSSTMQIIYKSVEDRDKVIAAFAVVVLLFTVGVAFIISAFTASNPILSLIFSLLLSMLAVMIWIIANVDDKTYKNVDSASATGGSIDIDLPGDTNGFES